MSVSQLAQQQLPENLAALKSFSQESSIELIFKVIIDDKDREFTFNQSDIDNFELNLATHGFDGQFNLATHYHEDTHDDKDKDQHDEFFAAINRGEHTQLTLRVKTVEYETKNNKTEKVDYTPIELIAVITNQPSLREGLPYKLEDDVVISWRHYHFQFSDPAKALLSELRPSAIYSEKSFSDVLDEHVNNNEVFKNLTALKIDFDDEAKKLLEEKQAFIFMLLGDQAKTIIFWDWLHQVISQNQLSWIYDYCQQNYRIIKGYKLVEDKNDEDKTNNKEPKLHCGLWTDHHYSDCDDYQLIFPQKRLHDKIQAMDVELDRNRPLDMPIKVEDVDVKEGQAHNLAMTYFAKKTKAIETQLEQEQKVEPRLHTHFSRIPLIDNCFNREYEFNVTTYHNNDNKKELLDKLFLHKEIAEKKKLRFDSLALTYQAKETGAEKRFTLTAELQSIDDPSSAVAEFADTIYPQIMEGVVYAGDGEEEDTHRFEILAKNNTKKKVADCYKVMLPILDKDNKPAEIEIPVGRINQMHTNQVLKNATLVNVTVVNATDTKPLTPLDAIACLVPPIDAEVQTETQLFGTNKEHEIKAGYAKDKSTREPKAEDYQVTEKIIDKDKGGYSEETKADGQVRTWWSES